MNCQEIQTLMSRRIDEALDDEQCAALENHLAGCDECSAVERSLGPAVALLRGSVDARSHPALVAGIMAAVDAAAAEQVGELAGAGSEPSEDEVFRQAMVGVASAGKRSVWRLVASHVAVALFSAAAALLLWVQGGWILPQDDAAPNGPSAQTASGPDDWRSDRASPATVLEMPSAAVTGESARAAAAAELEPDIDQPVDVPAVRKGTEQLREGSGILDRPTDPVSASAADLTAEADTPSTSGPDLMAAADTPSASAADLMAAADTPSASAADLTAEADTPSPEKVPLRFDIHIDTAPLALALRQLDQHVGDWMDRAAERRASAQALADQALAERQAMLAANAPPSQPLQVAELPRRASSAPVSVLQDGQRLVLTVRGSPAEIIPSLLDLLGDADPRAVDLALSELERIRADIESDPVLDAAVRAALDTRQEQPLLARVFGSPERRQEDPADSDDPANTWDQWWAAAAPHLAVAAL